MTTVTEQRTPMDGAHVIQALVDQQYPHVETIRLGLDKLPTHTTAARSDAFAPSEAKSIAET